METNNSHINPLLERVEVYTNKSFELQKLKIVDSLFDAVPTLAMRMLLTVVILFFVTMLNIALALWLGELLHKLYFGFLVVAGIYGLAIIVLFVYFSKFTTLASKLLQPQMLLMYNQHHSTSLLNLKQEIQQIEFKQQLEWLQIKQLLLQTFENLKPVNFIKNSIKDIVSDQELKGSILQSTLAIGAGFVVQKVIKGVSSNPLVKTLLYVLDTAMVKKTDVNANVSTSTPVNIFKKVWAIISVRKSNNVNTLS